MRDDDVDDAVMAPSALSSMVGDSGGDGVDVGDDEDGSNAHDARLAEDGIDGKTEKDLDHKSRFRA